MNVYYEGKDGNINELCHYGVLGMKWGVRRANRLQKRADKHRRNAKEDLEKAREFDNEYKSYTKAAKQVSGKKAKRFEKMAESAKNDADFRRESAFEWKEIAKANEAKSKKIRSKHERLAGKRTLSRVENMSVGKALVQTMAFGSYGAMKYNQARASSNASRGKAAITGLLYGAANGGSAGIVGIIEPRLRS